MARLWMKTSQVPRDRLTVLLAPSVLGALGIKDGNMRHRLLIAAALLALPLAGCGDDSHAPNTSTSTTPATASPSPIGPIAPVLPEAAKANTTVGAKAFVRYWFEALNYASHTGDSAPLVSASTADCVACNGLRNRIKSIYGVNEHMVGGDWHLVPLSGWFGPRRCRRPCTATRMHR
jgi:hypothetical protein